MVRSSSSRRKIHLSADDIDELIDAADDEKVRRFWQTIKEEKLRGGTPGLKGKYKKFLSIPLYNNSIAIIFVLATLSFTSWFLFSHIGISLPVDITQTAIVIVFAFSAIMFHRYVSDKEEIVGMLDELAGYSIQNESVFENIGSALIVVDATGKVTKVNSKAVDILGASVQDLIGKNCKDVFTKQELADLLLQTLRTGSSIVNYGVGWESSEGRGYSFQVTTSLLQNKRGHTIGAVEVINDITEIRELQEKLKLNEHLASIGELSAKLGHEIGNSLGGIKLFTDNLLDELPPEDHRREYAEEILSEIELMKTKVSELKDYFRPIGLDLRKTNVNELLDEALAFAVDRIQEKDIIVRKDLSQDLPDVMIDPDQMRGAVLNILINATQAMTQGGELTLSTKHRDETVELSVSDTGSGIPEEIRGKIFNPFFTTKKELGTGLGLSIVYKTIEAHYGTVRFDSEVGRGTTFIIGLPLDMTIQGQNISSLPAVKVAGIVET